MVKRCREEACPVCAHFHDVSACCVSVLFINLSVALCLRCDGMQYEGGEPCTTCGHVYTKAEGAVQRASKFPSEIVPGRVFLGSFDNASRVELLKAMGITHILNVRTLLTNTPVNYPTARNCIVQTLYLVRMVDFARSLLQLSCLHVSRQY